MLKKILLTVGSILLGVNFGFISCISPIYLAIIIAAFPSGDPIDIKVMAVTSIITCVITAVSIYIYGYKKKREHEDLNRYGTTIAISFAIGALLMAVLLFILSGDPNFGAGNRLL